MIEINETRNGQKSQRILNKAHIYSPSTCLYLHFVLFEFGSFSRDQEYCHRGAISGQDVGVIPTQRQKTSIQF
jgi:hypothetical protein